MCIIRVDSFNYRFFEAGIYTIRGEIRECDNYEPKLVDY